MGENFCQIFPPKKPNQGENSGIKVIRVHVCCFEKVSYKGQPPKDTYDTLLPELMNNFRFKRKCMALKRIYEAIRGQ